MSSPFHSVRSDHTGALRTPDWLRDLHVEHHEGRIDATQLRTGQARAVGDVIRRQEQIGLPVVTDGELLKGVHYDRRGATTQSLVMRSKSGTVRMINARHNLAKLGVFSAIEFD